MGEDEVGPYSWSGRFTFKKNVQKIVISMVKKYEGKYDIKYQGYKEGNVLKGMWNMGDHNGEFYYELQDKKNESEL